MVGNEQRVGYAFKNLELQVLDNHFLQALVRVFRLRQLELLFRLIMTTHVDENTVLTS